MLSHRLAENVLRHIFDQGFYLLNSQYEKTNISVKREDVNECFVKEAIWIANELMQGQF